MTLTRRMVRPLATPMILTALIQLIDIVLDAGSDSYTLLPGLIVFCILFLVGANRLSKMAAQEAA